MLSALRTTEAVVNTTSSIQPPMLTKGKDSAVIKQFRVITSRKVKDRIFDYCQPQCP